MSGTSDDPAATAENSRTRCLAGTAVIVSGASIYVGAALTVSVVGKGQIRFTADTADTIPMWHPWLAAAIGIGLLLITPATRIRRSGGIPNGRARLEACGLLMLAMTFTVLLTLLGPAEPNYTVLKLTLLLVIPVLLFTMCRRAGTAPTDLDELSDGRRRSWWPLAPALGWTGTYLALSVTHPGTSFEADVVTVIVMVLIGFLINAVLEEFFYRRWLQTRWEQVLGGVWPAIIVSSLAWASWHIAIQGTGDLAVDLANVVANQGVTGLFLGLLWQRHRVMWPLLLAHGVMNANPLTLF